MANEQLRQYAKDKGVLLWEIAAKFGVNDGNFSRRLRVEFAPEERTEAMRYVDEIAASRR